MGEVVPLPISRRPARPVPSLEMVMERLFEAIDLIDAGPRQRSAARRAVCDACDLLLRREERALAWPKR